MAVEIKNSWRQTYKLHTYEVDAESKAHPHILFSMLLDAASSHVRGSQFSYEHLLDEGRLWVLSRIYTVFHKLPEWKDEIILETWGKGIDRLFGMRDFIVTSKDGSKLLSATSAWLLIDRKTMRPKRLDKLKEDFPFSSERQELDIKFDKLPGINSGTRTADYTVRHSDIDLNRHLTSSKYFQWIYDSFSSDFLAANTPSSVELNFLAEANINQHAHVMTEATQDDHICEIIRDDDSTTLCRAKLTWKKKN